MKRLAILALLVFAAPAHAGTSPSWGVTNSPFNASFVNGSKTVAVQDPQRLRYVVGGVEHRLTNVVNTSGSKAALQLTVATDEPGRTANVRIEATPRSAHLTVTLVPATGVDRIYDAYRASGADHFLGGGERGDQIDLRGGVFPLAASTTCTYAPVGFFASSAGWGLRLRTTTAATLAFPGSAGGTGCAPRGSACPVPPLADRVDVCVTGPVLDEDVYVGSPADVVAAHYADVPTAVPPPSQLALIKWRDVSGGPADVLDDVTRFQSAQIPLGWELVDNPWETCVGTMQWDRSRFPDPAGLIKAVHDRGVKFMLWVSPILECNAGYSNEQLLGDGTGRLEVDLRNPSALAEFQSRLRAVLSLGVDGVKGDRGEEVDVGAPLQNRYPLLYEHAVVDVLRSLRGNDFGTIFRAGSDGTQSIVHGMWGGDQPGDFVGLGRAVRLAATAGASGFSVWGSDIGGYQSAGLTPEAFARWAQLGAVSPVMEVGGTGPNATPWVLGDAAMDALRKAATLHYELFPYLYGLIKRNAPVLQPLGARYPGDETAWSAVELLVGPDLLAAPVLGPGTTPYVYLPAGSWIDLYTGATVRGGSAFNRPTPLDQFPLYARAGAVVPFNLRTATRSWWSPNDLDVAGKAGFLVANGVKLALTRQPRDVQLFVPAPKRPARVTLAGKRVAWTWNDGPLPGVVVRVHGPAIRGRIALVGA